MNLETFEKGSVTHLLVLLVSASLVAVAVLVQRATRTRHPRKADSLRFGAGIAVLLFQIVHNVYWLSLRQDGFSLEESLPLHFCDITGLIAAAALLFPDRRLITLLYFWGVGLSSTAFAIPVIVEGPAFLVFWTFWASHLIIVGGGIFFVLAEGFQPRFRNLLFSLCVTTAYVFFLLALNLAIGTNYGYVGRESPPTAFLGAWPVPRLPLLFLGGALLQTAAWAPFGIVHWRTRQAARP